MEFVVCRAGCSVGKVALKTRVGWGGVGVWGWGRQKTGGMWGLYKQKFSFVKATVANMGL